METPALVLAATGDALTQLPADAARPTAQTASYAASPGGIAVVPAPNAAWYYCESARAYYPVVQQCAGGWRVVAGELR